MTPQARTKRLYEAMGYRVGIVERWIPQAGKRIDLFGMFDLLAFNADFVVGVQATSGSNVAARVAKIRENPLLEEWYRYGRRGVAVVGWSKAGARGKRKVWTPRIVVVDPEGGAK